MTKRSKKEEEYEGSTYCRLTYLDPVFVVEEFQKLFLKDVTEKRFSKKADLIYTIPFDKIIKYLHKYSWLENNEITKLIQAFVKEHVESIIFKGFLLKSERR